MNSECRKSGWKLNCCCLVVIGEALSNRCGKSSDGRRSHQGGFMMWLYLYSLNSPETTGSHSPMSSLPSCSLSHVMAIRTVLVFFSYQICSEGKKVPVVNCGGSPTLCFKESLNKMITHSEALNKVQTEQSSLAKVEGKFPLSRWLPQAGQRKNQDTQASAF